MEPDDRLRVSRSAPWTCLVGADRFGQSSVILLRGRAEMSAPAEWRPFLERLITAQAFTAREAMTWGPPGDAGEVCSCLEALLEQGFIERDEA
jgi:hypothetical protein